MIEGGRRPVLVHRHFGRLYGHGRHHLIGALDIDPSVRPPRINGQCDAEVLFDVDGIEPEQLGQYLDQCAGRVDETLHRLATIRQYAIDYAPAGWREHYSGQPGLPLVDRLFLDGIEVDPQLTITLIFDFGDLDQLSVQVDGEVHLRT